MTENKTAAKITKAYGAWPSSIDAQKVAASAPRISETRLYQEQVYWLQSLPHEGGRTTVMLLADDGERAILPQPWDVRSKVHEYGGGSYCFGDDVIFFCQAHDQQIYTYRLEGKTAPQAITQNASLRFADLVWDAQRQRIIAVCEDHSDNNAIQNRLVSIDLDGTITTLADGWDFFSSPRLNANATHLCWLTWQHPNMPWDTTHLHKAAFDEQGQLHAIDTLKNDQKCSITQPLWDTNGDLFFVSDHSNWWNIYRCPQADKIDTHATRFTLNACDAVTAIEAEFATPAWVFAMRNYCLLDNGTILASYTQNGQWQLCTINVKAKTLNTIGPNCSAISDVYAEKNTAVCIQSSPVSTPSVCIVHSDNSIHHINKSPITFADEISPGESITFPTSEGDHAHAFFYPAMNTMYEDKGPSPVIVICHGGPTGQTTDALNTKIQFWTNRGFAVVDVNYRGSTGFGRKYRQRLYQNWGVLDVDDMCAAVKYLVDRGDIDHQKVIIKGSSAGGYTVLAALAFTDTFNAGVSLYGIGDLSLLANDTHKFEARYLDNLVGAYPQEIERYTKRSPIHAIEQFNCPVLLFQGLQDNVVPPNQARTIEKSLAERGLPVALIEFANEGHGFRSADTIDTMLTAELYFYQRIFQLENTFASAPITIKNSDSIL